jgi:hypothetical protein
MSALMPSSSCLFLIGPISSSMINEDDWRLLGQEAYLTGVPFLFRRWSSDNPDWDHDRCVFCWAKFSDRIPNCLI